MSHEFVHLHVHTDYSLLDGACEIKRLAELASSFGMKAVAMTDHGNLHGAIDFYKTMKDKGIKPIIGCEFYMAPGDEVDARKKRDPNAKHKQGYHQLLLAKDLEGYQNLCRLSSSAFLEGYYHKPRIDKHLLSQHAKGLIATTSCIGSEVNSCILEGDHKHAKQSVDDFVSIFGRENFFVELQDHGIPEQHTANAQLLQYAKEFDLKIIASNDVHYLKKEHALPHEMLLCIGTQSSMQDPTHMKFSSDNFYLKSAEEMAGIFPDHPAALANTQLIAEMCNLKLDFKTNHYPVFEPPEGMDRRVYLTNLCMDALPERYGFDVRGSTETPLTPEQQAIVARVQYEIGVIDKMGFVSYFLVVWDFLHFARNKGIPVGPGRGSGAGSIVAFLLHITDVEPVRYNLLFERFLNPDRVSPPDFDIDFCERRRVEVIDYVRQRYGADRVAQIATFSTLKPKNLLRDIARVTGRSFEEGLKLSKLIPADPKVTLASAPKDSPDLPDFLAQNAWAQEIYQHAEPLEGLSRNLGIHAAGVIIGDQPLTNLVPLAKGANDEVITQYDAKPCESLGLLKMDFLGLRTLTIIQDALEIIERTRGLKIDFNKVSLDDPKTYEGLRKGNTACVFQLESSGMTSLCRAWGVTRMEDIIALIALYRPGPMQYKDEFIDRKHGRKPIPYLVPEMKPLLEETYGIMLYQEQVMQVVQTVGGFSLGEADIMRRIMGKKKKEEMAAQEEKFIAGAVKRGITPEVAKQVWEDIKTFADYGFNKSHSAAYAFVAYRTAYLKAHYPVEFMCSNLTNEMHAADRQAEVIGECRDMGIAVLPPDVSVSELAFTVDGGNIRFGLAAVKGVGEGAAMAIINARKAGGRFASLQDFCERVGASGNALNKRLMECLCRCGAFDCFGLKRAQILLILEEVLSAAQSAAKDRAAGQDSFFDSLLGDDASGPAGMVSVPDVPELATADILKAEKELLGFYVTGHPLGEHAALLKTYALHGVLAARKLPSDAGVRLGGIISGLSAKVTKNDGKPWAILTLEDRDADIEVLVYSDAYAANRGACVAEAAVFIEGYITHRESSEQAQIVATKVIPIAEVAGLYARELYLSLPEHGTTPALQAQLQGLLKQHPGDTVVVLCLHCAEGEVACIELGRGFRVKVTPALEIALRRLLGDQAISVKADKTAPVRERPRWQRDRDQRGAPGGGQGGGRPQFARA